MTMPWDLPKDERPSEKKKVWVIMGNDFPESVWGDEEKVNKEIERLKKEDEDRLKKLRTMGPKVYYRSYAFEVQ